MWYGQPIKITVLALYVARSMNPFHVRHFNLRYFSGVLVLCFIVSCENNLFYWDVSTNLLSFVIFLNEWWNSIDFSELTYLKLRVFVKSSGSRSKVTVNRVQLLAFWRLPSCSKKFQETSIFLVFGFDRFFGNRRCLLYTKGGFVRWTDATIDSFE